MCNLNNWVMRSLKLVFLFMVSAGNLNGQVMLQNTLPPNTMQFVLPGSTVSLFRMRPEYDFQAQQIFTKNKYWFGLSADDSMFIRRTATDEVGIVHFQFRQLYKGIEVEDISYNIHQKEGRIVAGNGKVVAGLKLNTIASISPDRAIDLAIEAVPAEIYYWQDPKREASLRLKKKDEKATHYPTATLKIIRINRNGDIQPDNYMLAYEVPVMASKPHKTMLIYIDAVSGKTLREESTMISCSVGAGTTTFNGVRTVYTGGFHSTYDDCIDGTIYSYDYNDGDYELLYGVDNIWGEDDFDRIERMVITSLWGVRKTNDYFYSVHELNGFDGGGDFIEIFNNYIYDDEDCTGCNASWDSFNDNMYIGTGQSGLSNMDDYNTLDIVGHEFTHGIAEEFPNIDGNGLSGAINEMFADIFGNMVEFYTEGGTIDSVRWRVGEDRENAGGVSIAIRNMANPNAWNHPDTYLGSYWTTDLSDNSKYVHTNNNVGNYAYYLMSVGGAGVNDNGFSYDIDGIGHTTARVIAFYALLFYMDSDPTYEDTRAAFLMASDFLFGTCSNESQVVADAWQAVGVGLFSTDFVQEVCGTYGSSVFNSYAEGNFSITNQDYYLGVYGALCNATISSTYSVTFEAGNNVYLKPGFHAPSGTQFTAFIDPCELTEYRLPAIAENYEEEMNEQSGALIENNFEIIPNPSQGIINLKMQFPEGNYQMMVFNSRGELVAENNIYLTNTYNNTVWDLSALAKGIYVVKILGNEVNDSQKIVIQ